MFMRRLVFPLALMASAVPLSHAETIDNFAMTYTIQPDGSNPITTNLNFSISSGQLLAPDSMLGVQYIHYDNIVVNDDPDSRFGFVYSPRQGYFSLGSSDRSMSVGCGTIWNSTVALSSTAPYLGPGVISSISVPGYCFLSTFGTTLLVTDLKIVVTQQSLIAPPPPPVNLPGAVAPEPNSLALLSTGIVGVGTALRRRVRA